ncbi:MAG: hypothetical protein LBC17_00570 [Lactobacillaceae bacterium]|jgi:hypothetical protein|nr:hypothetical protein [Lactobacillaceae bacterium]
MFKKIIFTILAILILAISFFSNYLGINLTLIESFILLLIALLLFYFAKK